MNKVTTPVARLSFPAIWEPQSFTNKDGSKTEPKFSVTLLFPKSKEAELKAMKELAMATLHEKWPKGLPPNFKNPFRDGSEKPDTAGYEGTIFVKASSSRRPKVVDMNLQEIIDKDLLYAGCYVRASVNCYIFDQMGNKGVAFGLLNLQKVKDGEAFGITSKPEEDFFDSAQVAAQQGVDSFGFGANTSASTPAPSDPFAL